MTCWHYKVANVHSDRALSICRHHHRVPGSWAFCSWKRVWNLVHILVVFTVAYHRTVTSKIMFSVITDIVYIPPSVQSAQILRPAVSQLHRIWIWLPSSRCLDFLRHHVSNSILYDVNNWIVKCHESKQISYIVWWFAAPLKSLFTTYIHTCKWCGSADGLPCCGIMFSERYWSTP